MKSEFLSQQHVICNPEINSKKAIFETIARDIYKDVGCENWDEVFDALITREKYGSTGFGDGIAIPHCRLASCTEPQSLLLKLKNPVDFDAIDKKPVDIVVALIVPSEENDTHLEILSKLSEALSKKEVREALRRSECHSNLYNCFFKALKEKHNK